MNQVNKPIDIAQIRARVLVSQWQQASQVRSAHADNAPPPGVTDPRAEFERLDSIVRKAAHSFYDAGRALGGIRDQELWRAGGHSSWNSYCQSIASLTRRHVNRLIQAYVVVRKLEQVGPRGPTSEPVVPQAEFQARPLLRIRDDDQLAIAWARARELGGDQPAAEVVKQAVAEILAEQPGAKTSAKTAGKTRAQQRRKIFDELKNAITGIPNGKLHELVALLEPLI